METQSTNQTQRCGGTYCHKRSVPMLFLKAFIALPIIFFVMLVGMCVGLAFGNMHYASFANATTATNDSDFVYRVSGGGSGRGSMMWTQLRGGYVHMVRLFGTIESVEGNLITITTNGNRTQDVISTDSTLMTDGGSETGLLSLDENQDVIVYGFTNKDNQLEAVRIDMVNYQD